MKKLMAFVVVGLLAVAFQAQADEGKISQLDTALSSTTISGYVDVAATYNLVRKSNLPQCHPWPTISVQKSNLLQSRLRSHFLC
jgi:hypothetical protein